MVEEIIALIGFLGFAALLGVVAYGSASLARGIAQGTRRHETFTSFDEHLPLRGRWLAYLASTPLWALSLLLGAVCLIMVLGVGAWGLMRLLSAFSGT
jgi:hypothetical protein